MKQFLVIQFNGDDHFVDCMIENYEVMMRKQCIAGGGQGIEGQAPGGVGLRFV